MKNKQFTVAELQEAINKRLSALAGRKYEGTEYHSWYAREIAAEFEERGIKELRPSTWGIKADDVKESGVSAGYEDVAQIVADFKRDKRYTYGGRGVILSVSVEFRNEDCLREWESGKKIVKFVGYDAGEVRRVQHGEAANELNKKIENRYPLFEWGWDRAECVRVIQRAGLPLPEKSSCYFCPSMKKKEIQALWEHFPDLFQRAVDMEQNAAVNLQTTKGLGRSWAWGDYYAEFMRAKAFEEAQITFDDLFPETKGGCLCGAPCGCYDG